MRVVKLVAMFTLIIAMCAVRPMEGKWEVGLSYDLLPPPGAPEPDASGMYTFAPSNRGFFYVSVHCENLTPRQSYVVYCFDGFSSEINSVRADRSGQIGTSFRMMYAPGVFVANADGVVVLQ